ncbi:MAG TPA: Lrp/AsnC ligand binding domain-containing protein [Allosphingosinicella sp.]|nr:Lrp/AsnC ligand binding domain-containing protein [Allosphingosinicella sp.]
MIFFVSIRCKPGKTNEVGLALAKKSLAQVEEIYSVSGDWDLMVQIRYDRDVDFEADVLEAVLQENWDNVERTQTVIAYRVYDPDDIGF